ncbi:hypothetical protein [Novosphingobium sp.]|uniref:hypothetical protein n=1 Tax=Novosphingobium sp. TaxID=1874826 RepID=UPI00286AA990|nr:hypothetical protein [Novosphingobium sp.]
MNLTRDRLHSMGWAAVLLFCLAFTVALTFRVNAVKSQVRLTERKIAVARQQALFLETEFEARANQQQLKSLNDVEFGYQAPTAGQYLENERQLASLGKARGPDAPDPIRVASAASLTQDSNLPGMVSPLTGKAMAAEPDRDGTRKRPTTAANLGERLSRVSEPEPRSE